MKNFSPNTIKTHHNLHDRNENQCDDRLSEKSSSLRPKRIDFLRSVVRGRGGVSATNWLAFTVSIVGDQVVQHRLPKTEGVANSRPTSATDLVHGRPINGRGFVRDRFETVVLFYGCLWCHFCHKFCDEWCISKRLIFFTGYRLLKLTIKCVTKLCFNVGLVLWC